ncbi:MAG: GNAT family N-acetyltransferase [Mobilitalea sp.]
MKHVGTVNLETERLLLRQFRKTDAEDMFYNWANSEQVAKFLTWPPHTSVEVTQGIIDMWIDGYTDLKNYQWCIEDKESHQAIGSIGVVGQVENVDAIEIGYCIGEKYWHKGLMTEAFSKLIEFFFNEVECNRIYAKYDVKNPISGEVMKKCGLKYEGTHLQASRNNTGICDIAQYAILRSQYIISPLNS